MIGLPTKPKGKTMDTDDYQNVPPFVRESRLLIAAALVSTPRPVNVTPLNTVDS
jgi:hypothetical protein